MRNKLIIACIIVVGLSACKKDFLNMQPDETITVEKAFEKRSYAEKFLTDVYSDIPWEHLFADYFSANPYVVASDEMNIPWPSYFPKLMNNGSWNPINVAGQKWINMCEGIRKANIFLKHIHITPIDAEFTEADRNRWIGEAKFLRAFYHWNLMRSYGGIPIMKVALTPNDDFSQIKRNTWEECVNFVTTECDEVINLLPMRVATPASLGRPTAAVALALKARLLLYTASPLFNGNPDYANYTNNDGTKIFPQSYDANKWALAAAAAKECIDKCEAAGYGLYKANVNPVRNYQEIFINNNNVEVIWARNNGVDVWPDLYAFPRSLGGQSGLNPLQGIVDAYEMQDGSTPITGYSTNGAPIINPSSGYVEAGYATAPGPVATWQAGVRNMYVKREPRFYASINYNGAYFKNRRLQLHYTGADGIQPAGGSPDICTSGYLMKKGVDSTVDISQNKFSARTWIFFRLGEMYLNYAEALNESQGPVNDVYRYMNAIRNRAGLPNLPTGLDKDQMRKKIWHERQVELAFETHRYFDCHRWKIAAQTDNGPMWGMNVYAGTSITDDAFYKRTVIDNRVFNAPKHYFFPIPQSEIDKCPLLVQSPNW